MQCVVPLAGPQLKLHNGDLIASYPVDGKPLLLKTLTERAWWKSGALQESGLTFVLRAGPELAELRAAVEGWFPRANIVILPGLTQGALLTALAGAATLTDQDAPLVIDLADILYDVDTDMGALFADRAVGATVTYFDASEACYSYFEFNGEGDVRFAAEKKIISRHASAGTYFFRSSGHFTLAAGRSLIEARDELTFGKALFICPVVNSVVRSGLRVVPVQARNVRSVSKLLHGNSSD